MGYSAHHNRLLHLKTARNVGNWEIKQETDLYLICGDISESSLELIQNEGKKILEEVRSWAV